MYNGTITQAQNDLEEMVDKFSTSTIVTMLADIAREKAEHIRSNWQDDTLAKTWERLAAVLDKSYTRVNKIDKGI